MRGSEGASTRSASTYFLTSMTAVPSSSLYWMLVSWRVSWRIWATKVTCVTREPSMRKSGALG